MNSPMKGRLSAVLALSPKEKPQPVVDTNRFFYEGAYEAYLKHREQRNRYSRTSYARDPSRHTAAVARRRAASLRQMPAWADQKAINAMYAKARKLTESTGITHSVDHIIPLQGKTVSGLHVHYNLQVISQSENSRKSNQVEGSLY